MSSLPIFSRRVQTRITLLATAFFTLFALPVVVSSGASAKTPGKTYCFNRICHRVLTLGETRRAVGRRKSLVASYYSHCKVDRYNPCGLTSSGARFQPSRADNAASPIYPNGTKLLVWNPANKRAAIVRIDNAGPYWRNRTLDLSRAAAQKLGFRHRGVARLIVQVIKAPSRSEARYRRHRKYAPVKGYLGRFASIAGASRSVNGRTIKPTILASKAPSNKPAKVILPIKNIFLAERRLWRARMVEAGPISVALTSRPKIRLPIRTLRKKLASPPKIVRRKTRQVAALTNKSKPLLKRKIKARPAKVTRKKEPAIAKTKKRAAKKPTKSDKPVKAIKKPIVKPPAQPAKVAQKQATPPAASPAAKNVAKQPVVPSRPKMVWRHDILGTSKSGA